MAFQMVRGSMPGRKGPFRLSASDPAVAKIKKNIEAAEASKGNAQRGYQLPSLKRSESDKSVFELIREENGNVIGTRENDPKTVYDSNIISNEKIYNWGK